MDKPTYYGVLPAEVRYHPDLNSSQKVLYTEIDALSTKQGYCFASNAYFADLYGVHKITISAWIKALKQAGVIKVHYDISNGNVEVRKITPLSKNTNTPKQKHLPPLSKNTKYNNTKYNNNTTDEIILGKII
jgi:DNA-directed RNA polymerase beta subunit